MQEKSENDADHSHEEGELVGDYDDDDGVILAMNNNDVEYIHQPSEYELIWEKNIQDK